MQLERLTPYLLTTSDNRPHLRLDLDLGTEPLIYEVDDPTSADFARVLNWSNQLAFGGDRQMGMPRWVMLDCAILPGAIAGFALPRDELDAALAGRLRLEEFGPTLDRVPVSEYCACPTVAPDEVSGFSLHTQIEGRGLGLRTKALAMALYDARAVVGVTQFDNPAIAVHTRLGPMDIRVHRPAVHTHAASSLVYRTRLPSREKLCALARGERPESSPAPGGTRWTFDPDAEADHERLAAHLEAGRRAWIVAPGWRRDARGDVQIELVLEA
jgi:hypothetical protein